MICIYFIVQAGEDVPGHWCDDDHDDAHDAHEEAHDDHELELRTHWSLVSLIEPGREPLLSITRAGQAVWSYCWLGLMVYITFTIHSRLNLSAPSSDLSDSSSMSTSAKSAGEIKNQN